MWQNRQSIPDSVCVSGGTAADLPLLAPVARVVCEDLRLVPISITGWETCRLQTAGRLFIKKRLFSVAQPGRFFRYEEV